MVIYEFGIVDVRIVLRTWDPHKGNALDFIPLLIRPDPSVLPQQPLPGWHNVDHAFGDVDV